MARKLRARHAVAALLAVGITIAGLPAAQSSSPDFVPASLVTVDAPTRADRQALANLGLDLTEHAGHDYVEVVLHDADDAAKLAAAGFDWDVRIPDLLRRELERSQLDAAFKA